MEATTARMFIGLDANEARALVEMARADCRHPREQLRHLLRIAAQQRGLLSTHEPQPSTPGDKKAA